MSSVCGVLIWIQNSTFAATSAKPAYHGAIGVGSWITTAEFKDIVVTSNNVVLYRSDFEKQGINGWNVFNGSWSVKDGVLRQSALAYSCRLTTGDTGWANYTLSLRARKTGGREGLLIFFNWLDDNNWARFNIGYQNTGVCFQYAEEDGTRHDFNPVPFKLQTNVWYDIRVVMKNQLIECYINSNLVLTATYTQPPPLSQMTNKPDVPKPNLPGMTNGFLQGGIGVGAWSTVVEYTNIVVTSNNVVLYQSDFKNQGTNGWRVLGGNWDVKNGKLRQTAMEMDCIATTGNANWANYTISLRARKLGGSEGFLVLFDWRDEQNWIELNIGGWANSFCALDQNVDGIQKRLPESWKKIHPFATNVWYDIKVVLNGPEIECFLDSQLLVKTYAYTMVTTEAKYLGRATLVDEHVLQFRSHGHIFQCTLQRAKGDPPPLAAGSLVRVRGMMCIGSIEEADVRPGSTVPEFDMLLLSPDDVVLLKAPTWWTLRRLLSVVGLLMVTLALPAVWIAVLRRQVAQRTMQLQYEIRERERAEHQHALETERARIARDLHDDLGSRLTEINFLADTCQTPGSSDNAHTTIEAIAEKAKALVQALDVIVWAVDPEDNSLQSLADYLAGYTREYLSNSSIVCRFKIPITFPDATVDGRIRHELLMVVKETLNNIVRHAGATEVKFQIAVVNGVLEISIADNGKSFNPNVEPGGNGLKNCSARMVKIGGSCNIESRAGAGTIVQMRVPMPLPADQSITEP